MAYISFQPKDNFNSYEYEGTSSGAKVVTDLGFQPDMLWFKQYDATRSWVNMTSPQGVTKAVYDKYSKYTSPCPKNWLLSGNSIYE